MLADVAGAVVLAHSVHNPFLHKTIFFTYRGWRGGEPWRVRVIVCTVAVSLHAPRRLILYSSFVSAEIPREVGRSVCPLLFFGR